MTDDIRKTLTAEMDKACETNDDFKTFKDMLGSILELQRNPDAEKGDNMRWSNLELSLKAEMYLLTGIPSSGKSTWLDNVIINSISMHQYKWGVFSPESHPIELHMKQMIEIATETNFYGDYNYQKTTEKQIESLVNSYNDKLYMITPKDDDLTIESILGRMEFLVETKGVNAFVLDPYNEFSHTRPTSMSETEYVSRFLGDVRRFINKHNVMVWIVAHPTKLRKEEHTNYLGIEVNDYPVPTAYDIAGSANFYNKPDNIVTVHRDKSKDRNPDDVITVDVQKVRRKTTGKLGSYLLKFNYNDGSYASYNDETNVRYN